jgi:DNA repair exonuclease SbcCD ATPase subunit
MTLTAQENAAAPGREPGRCRYPGCPNPARASDAPGRPPGYCGHDVPEDRDGTPVLVRHTAMTAFRRRAQLSGQPGDGRPVTAAITRAGAIRDDALAAMTRLSGQLAAALDQLAVLGEQLAAAADPEAAEAQAEAVRAETAAQLEHARAETAGHAAARHAAELEAAEARAAAAEAITMMEAQAADLARAGETARAAAQELADARASHASELAAARAEAGDAARGREEDRARHEAALAALNGTVTTLREQLARSETALDRERERQHETVGLLRGLITSPQQPKTTARRPAPGG